MGRPLGLGDQFAIAAGNPANLAQAAIVANFGRRQRGAVPGHVGMIPAEPGELPAVWAEAGRAEEVVALGQDPAGILAIQADRDDAVDRLTAAAMILADRKDAPAGGVRLEIGIAQLAIAFRGQRLRRRPAIDPMEALVGEVRRHDHAVRHQPGAAAIFVHARADVEACRRDVGTAVGPLPDQYGPTTFLRPRLGPVDQAAVETGLAEPDLRRRHQLWRDRRSPCSVVRHCRHHASPRSVQL